MPNILIMLIEEGRRSFVVSPRDNGYEAEVTKYGYDSTGSAVRTFASESLHIGIPENEMEALADRIEDEIRRVLNAHQYTGESSRKLCECGNNLYDPRVHTACYDCRVVSEAKNDKANQD